MFYVLKRGVVCLSEANTSTSPPTAINYLSERKFVFIGCVSRTVNFAPVTSNYRFNCS